MPQARFYVSFSDEEENPALFSPTGIDRIEFLLSANPGEELKPLVRIASGGELSRILLALKSLLGRREEAETLIFDEVDAGIGGRTAELVGIRLSKLSKRHQVICITHLPQIACYGRFHYLVKKQAEENETSTTISMLTESERPEELARMLGGISISEKVREHARELLKRSLQA
jgi:DNA repair protein RecN (Recombination protein N)